MDYLSAEERYQRDAQFRTMVDVLTLQIRDLHLTPTEVREAAMLACIRCEAMSLRRPIFLNSKRVKEIQLQDLNLQEHVK